MIEEMLKFSAMQ